MPADAVIIDLMKAYPDQIGAAIKATYAAQDTNDVPTGSDTHLSLVLLKPILPESHFTGANLILNVLIRELSKICCLCWFGSNSAAVSPLVSPARVAQL